jgi:ABC-type sugar transport system substrate-binding protein
VAAGCGSSGGSSSDGTEASGSGDTSSSEPAGDRSAGSGGPIKGEGEIVFFAIEPSLSPTIAIFNKAAEEEAESLGFTIKTVTSGLDQSVQVQQIQQFIATGQKPVGFIVQSVAPEPIASSIKRLSEIAPVVQVQSQPDEGELEYLAAYAGNGAKAIGTIMGELLVKARAAARKEGRKLHSPEGNLLIVGPTPNYKEYEQRQEAFEAQYADEPFNVLQELRIEDSSTQGTYEDLTQILPQIKNEGIDFVISNNGDQTAGLIKALKQAGIQPGKDVSIVSGDCSQSGYGVTAQENGEVFGQVLTSDVVNGKLFVRTLAQYIATGESVPGEQVLPVSPDAVPPLKAEPPHELNFQPALGVEGKGTASKAKIWGESIGEICASS